MSEIKKVIDVALNEVGYIEKASNKDLDSKTANAGKNNYTKYARDLDNIAGFYNGKKNGYDWCDVFVDWCFVEAFGKERAMELLNQPEMSCGAGCGFSMNYYKKINQFFDKPKKGDQIFFTDGSSIYHTGLVYDVDNSRVYTVEGNTKPVNEVVGNGGQVCKKSYPLGASYIAGYGSPKYDEEIETTTTEPKDEGKKIEVDGKWGKETTTRAQEVFGTTVDGIISNQYEMYKKENPGLFSTTFEWLESPDSCGSELIKAIQEKVGAKKNGFIGPETITKMQKWLGTTQDGYVSNPSDMVRAFQKWLNEQV